MNNENQKPKGPAKRLIIKIVVTILFAAIYFYIELPAINLHDPNFYIFVILTSAVYCLVSIATLGLFRAESPAAIWDGIKKNCFPPVLICGGLIAIYLIGNLIGAPIFRASAYKNLLDVSTGDFTSEVEQISYNQIPMLDEDSAKKLGDRKMGELADMVSQFEVADDYTQINYHGRPVRVTPLQYCDIIKWFTNRSEGLPAYIIIDMTTQEVEVVRLEEGMKYTTAEYFGKYLYRHLRFNYPTFIFDDATFEIDEEGTPYWICPKIVKRIGLFGGTDIEGAVLVNAITGESEYYEEVPSWVDRVYTADIIIEQYDYYGMYQNGWFNSIFGQRNVTKTTDGYNYIVIGDDVYMYTGITSVVSDESNVGFILTNQRTKETKYYAIAGAEEYSAMASAEGVVQHLAYDATFPLLLNVSGQPTYFMALKDSAGLVKMYAMVNVQQYQIVATGTSLKECERNYISLLAENNILTTSPSSNSNSSDISGTIADIRTAVLDGNTHVYIKLEGKDVYYIISAADSDLAVILNKGDKVTISASDEEGELVSAYNIVRGTKPSENTPDENANTNAPITQ